jgi:hypothetical protein
MTRTFREATRSQPQELILRPKPVALSEFDHLLSSQIIACPNAPIEAIEAGKAVSVPAGTFDVEVIRSQLPTNFQPDLISLSARVMSFLPQGLEKFPCPKVMKIGDTFHFGDGTLSGMVEYCQKLNCDYHWTYQGAHHLHFFVEAGLRNVFWLPGTIAIEPYIPPEFIHKEGVIFRGGESELHGYRKRVLNDLRQSNIAIDIQSKPYEACLEDYAKAQIVINCSLNGDLNRRVFEVLMAGGFLLTDRISTQTGLSELFQEGIHLECYGDVPELTEKIRFYLAHPKQANQIAKNGHQKFIDCYQQSAIQQKLYEYVLEHKIEPSFQITQDRRLLPKTPETLKTRLKVYQVIQELHRLLPKLNLLYWKGRHRSLLSDLADLPRLQLTYIHQISEISEMQAWCTEVGVDHQIQFQDVAQMAQLSFQIVLIDADQLQRSLQEILPFIAETGLLLIVGFPNFAMIRLLKQQDLIPVDLSIELFQQTYPICLDEHGLIYQKKGASPIPNLTIQPTSFKSLIKTQLKSSPIFQWFRKRIH